MSVGSARRAVAGLSVFAVAAGFAVVAGVGVAGAAPVTAEFNSDGYKVTRTISNGTPSEGDVITSKTVFKRTAAVHNLYAVRDFHPACMTYVDGSATVNGSAFRVNEVATDSVRLSAGATEWPMWGGDVKTFEFQYRVGADCARGTDLSTTVHFDGTVFVDDTTNGRGPSINVQKNVSTTTLSPTSGVKLGQLVPLSATVTGGADGDSVEFFDGATKIGAGALANGVATLAWTPADVRTHSVTAKYLGNAKVASSTSSAVDVVVSEADKSTATAITGPASAVAGESVTVEATVSPTPAGGTVQFKDGATDLGGAVPVDANGKASLTNSYVVGAHSIVAVYSGSGVYQTSTSAPHALTVAPVVVEENTTTTLVGPSTGSTGEALSFTASVSTGAAGGTVQFKEGGRDLGSPVPVDASGKATTTPTFNVAGEYSITAVFSGSGNYLGSTSNAQTVNVKAPAPTDQQTQTVLTVPADAKTGTAVGLSVTVTPTPVGGTVQFKDGSGNLGSPVPVVEGKASIMHEFASVGTHDITAVYSGATGFLTSTSAAQSVSVTAPAAEDQETSITVSAPASAVKGAKVDLVAAVVPTLSAGTVQFMDGTTPIGGPVAVVNGKATLSHTFTELGDRRITAVFSGTDGYLGSETQAAVTVKVTAASDGGDPGNGGSSTGSLGSLENIFGS
ncbi:Ig-like domain-containing protein [Rhodococcus qingshengii]|uniref:Ig-like domain-containing protein n=1 Tax=Rhodococcus TaxID=1827 RepID=UPI000F628734|nr:MULTISPECIES: Ig-like domain-containing protein [Rhodococcus]AZI61072.1 Ig-like domain repeat protein [Rhodococcus sp. NJ-530]UDF22782.1 Ig-like domain-containing protein [Rhodococcus qingshengii]UXF68957.1 Ig-like domain-containing protein [Rhodococcus qingshengii]BDQ19123.1 Ig-like domain-containing protein [Rhodococcus qingshengii]